MASSLKPETNWRFNRANYPTTKNTASSPMNYSCENEISTYVPEDEENFGIEVIKIDNNRYKTSLHVSQLYIGCIIGRKGVTKKSIENDTKAYIMIPNQKQEQTEDITIIGASIENVMAARKRINNIVVSARMRQRPTHFISLPLNTTTVMENFEKFKEAVLSSCSMNDGVEDSLFISGRKLHLTVGVMCLSDNVERSHASKLLTEAREKVVMPLIQQYIPIKIRLKGLSCMNDDPKATHVLYCNVQEEDGPSGLLQKLTDGLAQYFLKAHIMKKEFGRDNVKMHVTLLNSRYRNQSADVAKEHSRNLRNKRMSFNGSKILKKFSEYDFGVSTLSDIHLSQMKVVGPDGYYLPTCVISLQ